MRKFIFCLAMMILSTSMTNAQSLTPEQILAQIEERISAQNPYQILLNDPDPQRSLAAIEIMLGSGDQTLITMATEFGLLSPNPLVQRIALEGVLSTRPILTIRLDGSEIQEQNFVNTVLRFLNGTVTPDNIGFVQFAIGEFDETAGCYLSRNGQRCLITVNADGVFISAYDPDNLRGRMVADGSGALTGFTTLYQTASPVPATISLLD